MKRPIWLIALISALSLPALAQEGAEGGAPAPTEPAPSEAPPPPEVQPAPPPDAPQQGQPPPAVAAPPAPAAGQWVWTGQYGWVWMPYGQQYTYVPADTQIYPYQYIYYPVYGWRWMVAPWVYGWGPQPYWGAWGCRYFGWYSRPWFRVGGYWGWGGYHGWGNYHGWVGPRSWGGRGWASAPAYYRAGYHGASPAWGHGQVPGGGVQSGQYARPGGSFGAHPATPGVRGGSPGWNHNAGPAGGGGLQGAQYARGGGGFHAATPTSRGGSPGGFHAAGGGGFHGGGGRRR